MFHVNENYFRMLYQLSKEKQKIQEQCKTVRCLTALKASTMDPHSRWITTASGYLRLLIFGLGIFGIDQKKNCSKSPRILYAFTCHLLCLSI